MTTQAQRNAVTVQLGLAGGTGGLPMAGQVIDRDTLGVLTKIGQGMVYGAINVKTKFAPWMDYEEYRVQTLARIDFTACLADLLQHRGGVAAISALVEDSLSYAEDERWICVAAWPCATLENGGAPPGFVRPAKPAEFFISLSAAAHHYLCPGA